eukprot:763817-Prymnesium_polylepis.1
MWSQIHPNKLATDQDPEIQPCGRAVEPISRRRSDGYRHRRNKDGSPGCGLHKKPVNGEPACTCCRTVAHVQPDASALTEATFDMPPLQAAGLDDSVSAQAVPMDPVPAVAATTTSA